MHTKDRDRVSDPLCVERKVERRKRVEEELDKKAQVRKMETSTMTTSFEFGYEAVKYGGICG